MEEEKRKFLGGSTLVILGLVVTVSEGNTDASRMLRVAPACNGQQVSPFHQVWNNKNSLPFPMVLVTLVVSLAKLVEVFDIKKGR